MRHFQSRPVVMISLSFCLVVPVPAAVRTWDGGGANDFWNTALNWSPNVAPVTGDALAFDGTGPFLCTNNYAAGFSFGSVTFSAPGYTVWGNPLVLTNGITLLGAIGPIEFYPDITLNADQTFVVSRFNASMNLHGALNLNGNTPTFFAAGTVNVFGPVSGVGGLIQTSGTVMFHANNTCSGSANIDGGTFRVFGSNPNLNANVNSGGLLEGTGSVRRIISNGGTINPGTDLPGLLTANATVAFDAGTTFTVQLAGDEAGVSHDQLAASDITLGGAALEVDVALPATLGQQFRIVNVTGRASITGTFAGLAEGATLAAGGIVFEITYSGGSGNDVVLEAVGYQGTGVTRVWDGGGADSYWSNPLNWVGNVAPEPGDSLRFTGLIRQLNTNDFPADTAFGVIDIDTAGFDIHGNGVVLISQLRGSYFMGLSSFRPAIRLANTGFPNFLKLNDPTGALHVAGDIDLNGRTLTLICEGEIQLAGAISGSGVISKGKDRSARFMGSAPNTFVGETIIFGGQCHLQKPAGVTAVPGNLRIGNELGSQAHVHLLANEQISNNSTVTVFTASSLDLDGFNETIHSLCLTGGVVTTMSGTLTVTNTIETKSSATMASITGKLALGGASEVVFNIANGSASPDLSMPAIISGLANVALTKLGLGELRFSGDAANTYAGPTVVSGGTLALNKLPGLTAIAGELIIGDSVGFLNSDRVRLDNANQIANSAAVTINRTGRLDLNNEDDVIGALTLIGGSIVTGTGLLTLSDSVVGQASATTATISGHLELGSGSTRFFAINQNATLEINAEINGGAGTTLLKTNGGELVLSAVNIYSGLTVIDGGTLTLTIDGAVGDTSNGTTLRSGVLKFSHPNGVGIAGESLTVAGPATITKEHSAGAWNGPVQLDTLLTVAVDAPGSVAFTDVISGTGGFVKVGAGTMTIKGPAPNTFTGLSHVQDGSLEIYKFLGGTEVISIPGPLVVGDGVGAPGSAIVRYGGPGQLADTVPVTMHGDGIIFVQGWPDTIGSLAGSGEVSLGILDSTALAIGGNGNSTSYAGLISGKGTLTKIGSGMLTLAGNNTYQGDTTVSNGTLVVNGVQPSSSVFVRAGATLGGVGGVARIVVAASGTLAPGASPGILSAGGIVSLAANSIYSIELNGLNAGSEYDQLAAPFAVSLSNSSLDLAANFAASVGSTFRIINKTGAGAVSGTFAGLPEGASITADGQTFQISYIGGDGNDVVLTRLAGVTPNFNAITPLEDGAIKLQAHGLAGQEYVIEAAEALALSGRTRWVPIVTNRADRAGLIEFTDANRERLPQRFYRLLLP